MTAVLDWGIRAWDPALHPRDRHGRFTRSRTVDLTPDERDSARSAIAGFKPRKFKSAQEQVDYLSTGPKLNAKQANAVDAYTGDAFLDINKGLRAGKADDSQTVKDLRSSFHESEDDLILNRSVGLEAFGKSIDDLEGKKVKDAAFSSTSLGGTYGTVGQVNIKIAVPKGTPMIFAAPHSRNPHEREVILPDGMEFAVASVKKNDSYGYDMSLIVLPKGGQAT